MKNALPCVVGSLTGMRSLARHLQQAGPWVGVLPEPVSRLDSAFVTPMGQVEN